MDVEFGDYIKKFSSSSNDDLFGFIEWKFPFREPYVHNFYFLTIVLSGSAIHQFNNKRDRVHIGDVFAVPPGVKQLYSSTHNLKVYYLLLHPRFHERYAADLEKFPGYFMLFSIIPLLNEMREEQMHFRLTKEELDALKPFLDTLAQLWKKTDEQHCVMRNSLGMYILARLFQWYEERHADQISGLNLSGGAFLDSIQTLLADYSQKLTIEDMAQRLHMSRSAYIAKFKALFGMAPGEFLLRYRLMKVKNFLAFTDKSLVNIAQETGFYNASHLIREFKKREGITPGEYRKQAVQIHR